jgi:hypothetical protein
MNKIKLSYIFYISYTLLIFSSCKKEECKTSAKPTESNCPNMYSIQSKLYINPYLGTLERGGLLPPRHIYPEKYAYSFPSVNPNNEYEFCYLRRENGIQSDDNLDLYKFNFCTGVTKLITNHVAYSPNWSVKDWIIFTGQNRDIWKVKSNGDSLTRLTFLGAYQDNAIWNTLGTMFIWNNRNIANEKGEIKYSMPNCGSLIGWYDDTHILNIKNNDSIVSKTNVINNSSEYFANIFGKSYLNYNKEKNEFIGYEGIYPLFQTTVYNLKTNTLTYFPLKCPRSFVQTISANLSSKLLLEQQLIDTLTGSPYSLNYRSHIAIMDLDGTNLRHVIIPE